MEDIKEFGTTIKADTEKVLESVAQEIGTSTSSGSRASGDATSAQSAFKIDINAKDEEAFREFMKNFDLESKKSEIASLLASNTHVHALYQQLVPTEISADEFWGRYFWKNEENAKKEQTRLQLLNKTKALASKMSEEEFKWDDDEDESAPQQEDAEAKAEKPETSNAESSIEQEARAQVTIESNEQPTNEALPESQAEEASVEAVEKTQEETAIESPSVEQIAEETPAKPEDPTVAAPSAPSIATEAKPEEEDVFDWN